MSLLLFIDILLMILMNVLMFITKILSCPRLLERRWFYARHQPFGEDGRIHWEADYPRPFKWFQDVYRASPIIWALYAEFSLAGFSPVEIREEVALYSFVTYES